MGFRIFQNTDGSNNGGHRLRACRKCGGSKGSHKTSYVEEKRGDKVVKVKKRKFVKCTGCNGKGVVGV